MKRYLAMTALLTVLAGPAAAQPAMAPMTTEGFRQTAMISDTFEIESSRLALERSRNARVRNFANQMIEDHTRTSQALMGGTGGLGTGTATGAVGGAVIGGLVGGPVGAVVGAGIGATAGATTDRGSGPRYTASAQLDARHADMLNRLDVARGASFDRLYGQMQVMAHREAIALYGAYAQGGPDPTMRTFTQQALPHLQEHLALAQRLPGARPARR